MHGEIRRRKEEELVAGAGSLVFPCYASACLCGHCSSCGGRHSPP